MRSGGAGARAGRALLLAAALASGCMPAHPGAPAPAPVRPAIQLSDQDASALAALLRLEDRRDLDTAALASFAASASSEVRRRAYLAAGRIGGPGAAALVRPGLRDADPHARAAAAFALGLLRDTASVEPLSRVAYADTTEPAREAVFALGRIGGRNAHTALAAVLVLARPDSVLIPYPGPQVRLRTPPVLEQALLTIWRFPRDSIDRPLLARFAASPDTALRWRAAYALMRLGDPATVPALFNLLNDPYPDVRALAARGLRAVVTDSANRRAEAQARLTAALQDSAPHVRINALGALASYRDDLVARAVQLRLRDPDANVAIAAAQALGALRQPVAGPALRALAADASARLPLRGVALAALVRVDPAAGLAEAGAWAANPDWRQRFYGASALGGASLPASQPLLVTLARDRDPRVAAQALSTFPQLTGDSLAPPRALLVETLGAPDPIVRAAAIGALTAKPDPADLELLLDSYQRAAADSVDDAALAAVDALAALQKAGHPAARAFFARFPRSRDYVVRRAVAAKLGGEWGPVTPVETGRDSAFYLEVVRRLVIPALNGASGPRVRVSTDAGDLTLELAGAEAPLTVDNFLVLVRRHYFDGDRWHRVVPNFVVQDGDPRGDGNGGPGWAIRDELNDLPYLRGVLGMALSGPDTGGSQFFLTLSPQPHLDAGYTVFGRLVDGWSVLDRIVQDDVVRAIEVLP